MYRFIVAQQLRKAFRQLNQGDHNSILRQFGPRFEHTFYGLHPLAGSRFTHAANRRWYKRLQTVFPDLRFEVEKVVVSGFPWNTSAAVEWRDSLTAPDGTRFTNQGVHMFKLRWGKVTELHIYCDTQKIAAIFDLLAQQGVTEADAAPIDEVTSVESGRGSAVRSAATGRG